MNLTLLLKKNIFRINIIVSLLCIANALAQSDTTSTRNMIGNIGVEDPKSITRKYTYNPQLNRYVYTEKIGNYDLRMPMFLTVKEYEALVLKEQMKNYYNDKLNAISGDNQNVKKSVQRDILPDLYVNSDFFESIFGGNNIDLIPQGSVGVDLGVRFFKNDNPAITPRNRTNWGFDFDQRISLGLTGNIGTRLSLNAQYDTQASFNFQNVFKLEYEPNEDDIIQKIELGNISMPMSNSLITGSQSLFGLKTELKFGRTTITGVFSEQKSERRTVTAQGGGVVTEFEITALDYDENRNFFLSQFFRDQYDEALQDYPFIRSKIQITRLEVWVTNRNNRMGNIRNIVAVQDLGEAIPTNTRLNQQAPAGFFRSTSNAMPNNAANMLNPIEIGNAAQSVITEAIRDVATVQQGFGSIASLMNQGYDYAIIENARKLEEGVDYRVDTKLGYISLSTTLSSDEVLAVAYQYTYGSEVFQVGEFANDGISATTYNSSLNNNAITNNCLVLKMLKSNRLNIQDPIWNLMMKNVYSLGVTQLDSEDFRMNIYYSDPSPINYILPADNATWPNGLEERILLNLFNFDRLNKYQDPQPGGDGFFDFIPGITVDEQYGKIIFTKVEPFGEFLYNTLGGGGNYQDPSTYNANQKKYVYNSMYSNTKAQAQMDSNKNKFQLKGRYKTSGRRGISLGAFNVPQGSVRVTAGGRVLTEGIDYIVNYQSGTVEIINAGLEASNLPIQVSVENNLIFGGQTTRFMGVNIEHKFNDKFILGGSIINLRERPYTQKTSYGQESVNNTIFGFASTYSTEMPFLTRWVNRIPTIETDAPSNLSVRGEFAYLIPGTPKGTDFDGETTVYLDDFETSQITLDIRSPLAWKHASTPLEFVPSGQLYGSSPDDPENLRNGYGRAKLAWYNIDPIFYSTQKPADVSNDEISKNSTRRIFVNELFPEQQIAQGETLVQNTLDLAYYPSLKGPYNDNPSYQTSNPNEKWGGIMRGMSYSDFQEANIEYIQFWLMDPYTSGEFNGNGELVFNLGNISEDILKDGRKQYENGLPGLSSTTSINTTSWGKVPAAQSLLYAFDNNTTNRSLQDVGLDGVNDAEEALFYRNNAIDFPEDPALDNYQFYLARNGNILNRYLNYNGLEGNSPVEVGNNNRGSTTLPDYEDINGDYTMNTVNSYYEYRIPIHPNIQSTDQYVNDIRTVSVETPNGQTVRSRWIQFKIPIREGTSINGIADLNSITHMRMYMTGFAQEMLLRFGTLDLVRGDWRNYEYTLSSDLDDPSDDNTYVEINSVNIIENETRIPIPYRMPPGVYRERLNTNNTLVEQNEQSLSYIVCNLEPKDSRAIFKNMNVDLRQYKYIKMFTHAEAYKNNAITNNTFAAFIRIGTDFTDNYYQIEIPLTVTPAGSNREEVIWPNSNHMTIPMEVLTQLKAIGIRNQTLNNVVYYDAQMNVVTENTPYVVGENRYVVKGNPSLGNVRSILIGVKNISNNVACGEFWFNELRLAELSNKGGWAAVGAIDANAADLMNISASGRISTAGFGAVDQTSDQRSIEDLKEYDLVMNLNAGMLLPKKWNLQVPISLNHSQRLSTPLYDPVYQDVKLNDRLSIAQSAQEKDFIKKQAESFTLRRGINLIGVKKNLSEKQKNHFYNPENLTFNYTYNEVNHRDYELQYDNEQYVQVGVLYNYAFPSKTFEPFKKNTLFSNKKYWQWLSDININPMPASVMFSSNITRRFNRQLFRDVYLQGVNASLQRSMPELQQRNYLTDYQYGINYNLTRSLRLNFNATNNSIVRNYYAYDTSGNMYIRDDVSLWDDFWNIGDPNHFYSKLRINYELPLNKLPYLSFIKAAYSYEGDFDWQRGSQVLIDIAGHEINTLQNANTHNLMANLTFEQLYSQLGIKTARGREKKSFFNTFGTMIKTISFNYSETNGQSLPGYIPRVGFFGTSKPSFGFMFGDQSDVRYEIAKRGYLTTFTDFNEPYVRSQTRNLNITANLQPLPDLRIDLMGERQYTDNYTETFEINNPMGGLYNYNKLIGNHVGSFNISTNMIATSFNKIDEYNSATFEKFKQNRLTIANRLAMQRGIDINNPNNVDSEGYPIGYGKTNQAVMIPAFLAAYTGGNAGGISLNAFRNFPIPGWNIRYTGLMRIDFFKNNFRRFSLSHGYRASYSLSEFRSNLEYDPNNPTKTDAGGNFLNEKLFTNVNLIEQFTPLIRADMEMKNSVNFLAEINRDRTVSISLDNDYLTEILSQEYRIGLGYRFKDVAFVTRINDVPTTLKSDLILKGDIAYRNEFTVIRNMEIYNNQVTSGQTSWVARMSAEYALTKQLTASYYFNYNFSKSAISTSFPVTTIRTGISVKYTFN